VERFDIPYRRPDKIQVGRYDLGAGYGVAGGVHELLNTAGDDGSDVELVASRSKGIRVLLAAAAGEGLVSTVLQSVAEHDALLAQQIAEQGGAQ
jgi:hypothetical protein